jgi:hypothetical protein
MPNGVKYSTSTPSGSLRRDNVALGVTGNLGPTANTGFYSMPVPASGKYIINKVAASGVPNFFAPQNDTELIQFAKNEGATGADTGSAAAVLSWIATQPNLEAANFEYEGIVTDGLVLNLDAGFVGSYPTINTTWYDLSGNASNGTLINGPTFNSANSGSIVFDGTNEYTDLESIRTQILSYNNNITFDITFRMISWVNSFYNGIWVLGRIPDPGAGTQSYLLSYIQGDGSGRFTVQFGESNGNAGVTVVSPSVIQTNTIYNFTYIYENGNIKLYQNGTLVDSKNNSTPTIFTTNQNTFFIGGDSRYTPGISGRYFNGNVYNAKIYNRALSATEVLQNYNALKGRFGL